ncbi:MAG: DMT family transporter [Planctomycetes bacterium]|nr:DMT family transporter [Planctomycetota bacterium]
MTPAPTSLAPHAWLLAMNALWGGSYSVVKATLATLTPFGLITMRFWLAVVCVLPFVLGEQGRRDLRTTCRPGLITGAVLAIGYTLQTLGMAETSASTGGFLSGLIVLLVAVGGWLAFGERLGGAALAGLTMGVAGIVLLCWPGAATATGPVDTPRGIALQIGASTSYAVHVLLLSHLGRNAPALAFSFWQLLVVAAVGTIAVGIDGNFLQPEPGSASPWTATLAGYLFYLGALATALGIAVQSQVQHRIRPTHVAMLFATQPLFAAVVAWAWLGDRMGPVQLLGGGLIVAGVVVAGRQRRA